MWDWTASTWLEVKKLASNIVQKRYWENKMITLFFSVADISMQDKMLIYDNEKESIGWAASNCEQQPKSSPI